MGHYSRFQIETVCEVAKVCNKTAERIIDYMDATGQHPDWSEFDDDQFDQWFTYIISEMPNPLLVVSEKFARMIPEDVTASEATVWSLTVDGAFRLTSHHENALDALAMPQIVESDTVAMGILTDALVRIQFEDGLTQPELHEMTDDSCGEEAFALVRSCSFISDDFAGTTVLIPVEFTPKEFVPKDEDYDFTVDMAQTESRTGHPLLDALNKAWQNRIVFTTTA